jgi:hypothetical protein
VCLRPTFVCLRPESNSTFDLDQSEQYGTQSRARVIERTILTGLNPEMAPALSNAEALS